MKTALSLILTITFFASYANSHIGNIRSGFLSPPDTVRPGVYWYFMDGCLSKTQMTKDLESMKEVGIGNVLFLEIGQGFPRGDVSYFDDEWVKRFLHGVSECERLGIEMTLGVGPGWAGSGGPWVAPKESMRHIVGKDTTVIGNGSKQILNLPIAKPYSPFFGEGMLTPELHKLWKEYYEDVAVIAFRDQSDIKAIEMINDKALIYRAPYSSMAGVPTHLPFGKSNIGDNVINSANVIDITDRMSADGKLEWIVPNGKWRIVRMGMRNNGAVTRPAPYPGLGFECDKLDSTAFINHFANSYGKLMPQMDPSNKKSGGLKRLHLDSWEMGAQNWTTKFAQEFETRRGYSPITYLPAMIGITVNSTVESERFLWDLRKTVEELILEQHTGQIKRMTERYGLKFSIEPYDMTPISDMRLYESADVPMCEFWTPENGFNTTFSVFEATSSAHVLGKPEVASESFTTMIGTKGFANYPNSIKNQGDWAFAAGINRFFYHTFAHKYFENEAAMPGMTMGGHGVNWDRGQTWWYYSGDYHKYIARCSFILQQGNTVADILYLAGENSPYVFRPPFSALENAQSFYPDRKGYNFDACTAETLISLAKVNNGKIEFPGGASYEVLILPHHEYMTPKLLAHIEKLLLDGATIIGSPPKHSPSLVNYPEDDKKIQQLALELWGSYEASKETVINIGKGKLIWGGEFAKTDNPSVYPFYQPIAELLSKRGVVKDFVSETDNLRYTHRRKGDIDIYFISNKENKSFDDICQFRSEATNAEIWNPVTGTMEKLSIVNRDGIVEAKLAFEPHQSWFVILSNASNKSLNAYIPHSSQNYLPLDISNNWNVHFNPNYGGTGNTHFEKLTDWKDNADEKIMFYSGGAQYSKSIILDRVKGKQVLFEAEDICNMARVYINDKLVTTLWCKPWRIDISDYVRKGKNEIRVDVVNLWVNRLIGDEYKPYDGVGEDGKWPEWLFTQENRKSGRLSYSTFKYYNTDSPLESSGMIGRVNILISK